MPTSVEKFLQRWIASGLISHVEASAYLSSVQPTPQSDEELIEAVLRDHKLTAFQVQAIQDGNATSLTLGNYQILDVLGQGGMGVVYRARHRVMKREVALKVLPAAVAKNPTRVDRFHREVEAAARLNHPHLVTAYDADEAKGTHFFCMELVEGNDLASQVKQHGPLQVGQAINCILQAARGLQYAHEHGITHRDIKPSNLLIDQSGTVKVLDLGLAHIDDPLSDQPELTSTGMVMGTIDYMAPEQALNTKDADARSDIYSLGISLWFLLTGRPAYEGSSLMARMLAHREAPLPALQPPAPAELNAIFHKMIAKNRDDRFQSMAEVIVSLERFATDHSLSPSPLVARRAEDDTRQDEFAQTIPVAPKSDSQATDRVVDRHATHIGEEVDTMFPETLEQTFGVHSLHESAEPPANTVTPVSAVANQPERRQVTRWLVGMSLVGMAALLGWAVFLLTRHAGVEDAQTSEISQVPTIPAKSLVPMFAEENVGDGQWSAVSIEGETVVVDVAGHSHQLWHNFPQIKGRNFRIRMGLTAPGYEGYAKICLISPGQADHTCLVSRRNGKGSICLESSEESPLGELVDWPGSGPHEIAFEIQDGRIQISLNGALVAQANVAPDVDWTPAIAVGGWRAVLHSPLVEYPASVEEPTKDARGFEAPER